jgi:hypothetical protein
MRVQAALTSLHQEPRQKTSFPSALCIFTKKKKKWKRSGEDQLVGLKLDAMCVDWCRIEWLWRIVTLDYYNDCFAFFTLKSLSLFLSPPRLSVTSDFGLYSCA